MLYKVQQLVSGSGQYLAVLRQGLENSIAGNLKTFWSQIITYY